MGVEVATSVEIQRPRFDVDQGPFPMETSYLWEDAPSGGTLILEDWYGRA